MPSTNLTNELDLSLERWANFYLLTSAAAAALIGLLFVVITLAAERTVGTVEEGTAKIRVYLTPTVVFFASVLVVAALLTFPDHTRLTATLCICLGGVGGLVYSGSLLIGGNKKTHEEWQDLLLYAIVPFAAYGLLVLGGVLLLRDPQLGLTLVAVGMLSLLTLGIRNSWAIAIDVVTTRPARH
jgi:hypothetical protein